MTVAVRPAADADHAWIVTTARALPRRRDAGPHPAAVHRCSTARCCSQSPTARPTGSPRWDHADGVAELLAIGGAHLAHGARAGRLVAEVRARARRAGCTRLVVVTTDENVGAQRFYAAMGFTLVERRVGAVDECRRRYKPTIPAGHPRRARIRRPTWTTTPRRRSDARSHAVLLVQDHQRVEPADQACGMEYRIGPFDSADAAEHWQDRVDQRNEEWDAADRGLGGRRLTRAAASVAAA